MITLTKSTMYRIFFLLVCLLSFTQVSFAQNNNPNAAEFKFVEEKHDFGNIPEGPEVQYDFTFTNVGKEPLIIQDCKASCGCTIPEWSRAPVVPGQKGKISVKYDTKDRVGSFTKSIYIASNAKSKEKRYEIIITGNVLAANAKDTPAKGNAPAKH